MKTRVYRLESNSSWDTALEVAVEALHRGELVAFPTETVYGLGGHALDERAVRKIFAAKGRPADNPLIVHVSDYEDVLPLVSSVPPQLPVLARHFWPGPLTVVVPRSLLVPDVTTGGLDSVAIRMPAHPVALALLTQAKVPVAAPSANRSGYPSPTEASHVLADLAGQVAVVLDGGPTQVGVESTVLDLTGSVPTILRPGGVTYEQLTAVLGEVAIDPAARAREQDGLECGQPVRSPGMKYRHYAPRAEAILVEGEPPHIWQTLRDLLSSQGNVRCGLLVSREGESWLRTTGLPEDVAVLCLGSRHDPAEFARCIFSALRAMDERNVDIVLIEGIDDTGLGLAVMNRLRRAAGGRIVKAKQG
ncbi:MAG: threonylcarbamoyl-AMP synthase [Firmicutes bacterium]|nr:threonylcarbamoyl-AMP synthase [Bacillota bacterium]